MKQSRRNFIKSLSSGVAGASLLSGGLMPLMANAQTSSNSSYKALVCINLGGGNDAFNMIVPTNKSLYDNYQTIRQGLALPFSDLQTLNPLDASFNSYGLHPSMSAAKQLFNSGKLAIIPNVGNLIEPIEKANYLKNNTRLPTNLFSHNDQANFASTLNNGSMATGWAGRIAETMSSFNINQQLMMNISLSGENFLQRGLNTRPYGIRSSGVEVMEPFLSSGPADIATDRAMLFRSFLTRKRTHLLQQYYSDVELDAWVMAQYVANILAAQPQIDQPLMQAKSYLGLSQSLAMVCKMIAANNAFNVKRQIFYINIGAYDTHNRQLAHHGNLMQELSDSLQLFYQALSALGYADKVTSFTFAEFGRTLSLNSTDGTDHGWGSHHLVMGDAIKGQNFYGTMPDLQLGSNDDFGDGRIIPTTSFDQYAATLAKWFGVSADDLPVIFPNLKNFNKQNLGFIV